MSEAEIYSVGERALVFVIIAITSIVVSLTYLICRVDRRKVSWYIFIICLVHSSLFIFLNIISMFDLVFSNEKGFKNFSKFISIFYTIFDYIDKATGFLIYPWLISYLESGHQTTGRKIIAGLVGIVREFFEPILISSKIILFIIILVILIVYRKHFNLGNNPIDYLFVYLDCYSFLDIYRCVGFFMVQIFIDCRTQKNSRLSKNYYKYSVINIINKTESYLTKLKKLPDKLNVTIQNYDKDKSSPDFIYIKELFKNIEEKVKQYELESNSVTSNNNINYNIMNNNYNIMNNNNNNYNIMNNNYNNIQQPNNKNEYNYNNLNDHNNLTSEHNLNKNIFQNDNNEETIRNGKLKVEQENVQNVDVKDGKTDKEKELTPIECNEKYKKYVRKIEKLKMLYKEIDKEYTSRRNTIKKCHWYNVIFFIAFGMAVVTDFILPITLHGGDDYSSSIDDDEHEKEQSTLSLALSIILSMAIAVLTSSYTLITVYSTIRRNYISGDFLYDKQINDDLNLLKTVQIICGYSFAVIFCNLYFWKSIDKYGNMYGKLNFYDAVIIPDYMLKSGVSILMIIKIVMIILFIIGAFLSVKMALFKNDLGKYNFNFLFNRGYDYEVELKNVRREKMSIENLLRYKISIELLKK